MNKKSTKSEKFNRFLDWASDYIAHRKGLLPLLGLLLIVANLILQFLPVPVWLAEKNLFLHAGLIISILGFLLSWAL